MPAKRSTARKLAPTPAPAPTPQWVVVQLTSTGEKEKNLELIRRSARRMLGDVMVFIPAATQKVRNESHTTFYLDGYIFIQYRDGLNYLKLQDTTYFRTVLCTVRGGKKTYCLLDNAAMDNMVDGVNKLKTKGSFSPGQSVKIVQGGFKGLRGVVNMVYEDGGKVQVHVPLASKPMLVEFPPNFLADCPEEI